MNYDKHCDYNEIYKKLKSEWKIVLRYTTSPIWGGLIIIGVVLEWIAYNVFVKVGSIIHDWFA